MHPDCPVMLNNSLFLSASRVETVSKHLEASCCKAKTGPGYASPRDAMNAPKEKLLYIPCIYR